MVVNKGEMTEANLPISAGGTTHARGVSGLVDSEDSGGEGFTTLTVDRGHIDIRSVGEGVSEEGT